MLSFDHFILPSATIVQERHFENGIVKLQWGEYSEMSDAEKEACSKMRTHADIDSITLVGPSASIGDLIASSRKCRHS